MRTARLNISNHVYHLIARCVRKEWLIGDDERALYLRLLGAALATSDWLCLAYALMSNHIHLAMLAGRQPLGEWTRAVHAPFANEVNRRRGRIGHVFIRGPKDEMVEPGGVADVIAYIHRNPVRAGVVENARDSSWTSHRAYLAVDPVPAWLRVDVGLTRAGFVDALRFDEWVASNEGSAGTIRLQEVRRLVRKRGAIELATPSPSEVPLVARPFAHIRLDPRRVIEIVSEVVSIPEAVLGSRGRAASIVRARRIAIHCARALGIAGCDIGAALGVTRQAVSKLAATRDLDDGMRADVATVLDRIANQAATPPSEI